MPYGDDSMIISEKQVMQLIKIAYMYLSISKENADTKEVNRFLLEIDSQQPSEPKEIK